MLGTLFFLFTNAGPTYSLKNTVAINIQFQNLPGANNEILKAFNSQNAAKALESYQPLSIKERKREKLKALQILKQSSHSQSLGDINLSSDTLALSLARAEGATLQAMLNLLSAKMIEQNKHLALDKAEPKEKIIQKVEIKPLQDKDQEDSDKKQEKQKEEEKKAAKLSKKSNYLDEVIENATDYLTQLKKQVVKAYGKVLDAISLDQIKEYIDESIRVIHKYAIENPAQIIDEKIIQPLQEFPTQVKKFIDIKIKSAIEEDIKTTFSADEIRSILSRSMKGSLKTDSLRRSVISMDRNLKTYNANRAEDNKLKSPRRRPAKALNKKLALHNV